VSESYHKKYTKGVKKMNNIKEKYLEEYKNYEINKFKKEFGIADEDGIVSEEDLEGEKDG